MTLVQRNWMMGYRIASEELHGEKRAEYGAKIIKKLSQELSTEYGKGFTKTNLYNFYSFYRNVSRDFPLSESENLHHTVVVDTLSQFYYR